MSEAESQAAWPEPTRLEGDVAVLEALQEEHRDELVEAATDGELWRLWYTSVPSPDGMEAYIARALDERDAGTSTPFAVRHRESGRIVGSTRFCHIDRANVRLEIGYTWYARSVQRTALNTECKLLLMSFAFERLGAIAVEYRTHFFNHASRRAIERLGAKLDGVLRSHQRTPDGSLRDTVVYSVIASEWPAVRQHLRFRLGRTTQPGP